MRFVLVHGWGFHAGIFADLVGHLDGAETTSSISASSLAARKAKPSGHRTPSPSAIRSACFGCSSRAAAGSGPWSASKASTASAAISRPRALPRCKRGLEREPGGTLQAFWRSCGAAGFAWPEALNVARLDEGLDWLMHWDARKAKDELACPVLALASRDDAIVPASMSEAVWRDARIEWSQDGGHVLPLRHPRWCARHVLEFANALPA